MSCHSNSAPLPPCGQRTAGAIPPILFHILPLCLLIQPFKRVPSARDDDCIFILGFLKSNFSKCKFLVWLMVNPALPRSKRCLLCIVCFRKCVALKWHLTVSFPFLCSHLLLFSLLTPVLSLWVSPTRFKLACLHKCFLFVCLFFWVFIFIYF